LALWMGLPLALLLSVSVTFWFARQIRDCRDGSRWAILVCIGAVLIHAMLEYPLDYAYFLLPLGLLMGSLAGLGPRRSTWSVPRTMFALPLAGMVAMLLWVGDECMKVEDSARHLRLFMMGIGEDRALIIPPPDVRLLDAPREYHRFWQTTARPGMTVAELDWMRDVSQRNAFPPAMLRYSLAAGLNGRPQEASDTLARICALYGPGLCEEGRRSWSQLQEQFATLRSIPLPTVR
jgi:hypothetical protein